jgi:hypothetical protein
VSEISGDRFLYFSIVNVILYYFVLPAHEAFANFLFFFSEAGGSNSCGDIADLLEMLEMSELLWSLCEILLIDVLPGDVYAVSLYFISRKSGLNKSYASANNVSSN